MILNCEIGDASPAVVKKAPKAILHKVTEARDAYDAEPNDIEDAVAASAQMRLAIQEWDLLDLFDRFDDVCREICASFS